MVRKNLLNQMQSLASKSQNNQHNNAFYGDVNPHIRYQKISRMMLKFKYFKRWQVKTKYTDWLIKRQEMPMTIV